MAITGPTSPLDIGDEAVLRWSYTPELTGVVTPASDAAVDVYPPDGSGPVAYTLANGVVEEPDDHYRLYVPATMAGTWKAFPKSATGATISREPAEWWVRPD